MKMRRGARIRRYQLIIRGKSMCTSPGMIPVGEAVKGRGVVSLTTSSLVYTGFLGLCSSCTLVKVTTGVPGEVIL